ncbi:TPA: energy-coupling factor ABC transporter substrate-binding protein [Methanocaldococcus jannaschii]|uniref:Cobalt transport protein CbiN n=2 Tax=Methanocaldococcus jannaschii TaxID=2190 RepID=CBIN_METJA|nr:energy-coupling factor ABC transporter substrate-binding protein [Methanocaldococcus jannaschii]Q58490.1 RecName: Full=Cobalt transport protein CbiN; AltName: Full=Energy-coupling factor transporter probable substrate-capture protein CbiN; Short=ECF transporter S component CbiN [Methanocaldococcus jannaschii DSM 2661]AAB99091.1 cobalt transport protein (cbiN) [Methanocaldococcus jannaschii DSM 2661]HII59492.1 energy-coupling factor ABC transporter substrate-binding protein [Methanocaldococcus
METKHIILLAIVAIIIALPLIIYAGKGEEEGYFGGSDDQGCEVVEELGYKPWFHPIWEPPSGEIESLLFALQAAIGAIIIGYYIGYYNAKRQVAA